MRHPVSLIITALFLALLVAGSVMFLSRTWAESPLAFGSVQVASPTPQYSSVEKAAIEQAQRHLRDHAKEYYLNKPDLSDLQVSQVVDGGGAYHVWFEQVYQGYPVFGNDIGVHLRKDGIGTPVVTGVGNPRPPIIVRTAPSPYPGPNGTTIGPALSAQDAIAKALPTTGSKALAQAPANAKLIFYPAGKAGKDVAYALTWQLRLTTAEPFGDWQVNVDAVTGEVLSKRNYVEIMPTPVGGQSQPRSQGVTAIPPATPNGPSQRHTLHSIRDVDWVRLNASAWYQYSIRTFNLETNADTKLEVYWSDGSTEMVENDDCPGGGLSSCVILTAPASGSYYIKVFPYSGNTTGRNTGYSLSATILGQITPSKVNLPLITKQDSDL